MKLLIIEDDIKLCNFVISQLIEEGFNVDGCHNGEDALYYIQNQVYDVIILDRMLPQLDGISILQKVRQKGVKTPVIITTAMIGINDRIDGLDAGADDYLIKPYAIDELLARIRALLRRPQEFKELEHFNCGNLILDSKSKKLIYENEMCELTKKEVQLMEFFMRNQGMILERDVIIMRVWGEDSFSTAGNLDTYISFLRRRLKNIHSSVQIKTIHSVGYRLEDTLCSES